ncbi:MAG: PDZ domain-containing protein [Actinobacteria bacterium]|nr:PDZ domain-containing protein [Actinomycetota bacterium]
MSFEPDWINTPPQLTTDPAPRRKGRLGSLALALVVGLIGGFIGGAFADGVTDGSTGTGGGPVVTAAKVDQAKVGNTSVAKAAAVISPSVVTVDSLADDGESIGTGIIISSDGDVVTNAHVVEDSTEVRVVLNGETEPRKARVLAADAGNDLALVRIENVTGLTAATFADPASLAVGDQVVAVGYALDLDGGASVTSGIISALNRTMQNEDGALNALIQTDAAISSGNSGGPLINMDGHVVGINTAVYRSTDTSAANNIGFAISVGEVKRVIEVLRTEATGEKRSQGYLGIALSDRTDGGVGAVVSEVASDSPAERAGLKVRDIILQVNDQPITGQGALIGIIRDATPDDEVEIVLERNGERITVKATLVARPSE